MLAIQRAPDADLMLGGYDETTESLCHVFLLEQFTDPLDESVTAWGAKANQ
jgi:hypothetical protein